MSLTKSIHHSYAAVQLPKIISSAEQQVCLGVQSGSDLAKTAVTAGTLQTVLVPVAVERSQQVSFGDGFIAAGTVLPVTGTRRRRSGRRLQTLLISAADLSMTCAVHLHVNRTRHHFFVDQTLAYRLPELIYNKTTDGTNNNGETIDMLLLSCSKTASHRRRGEGALSSKKLMTFLIVVLDRQPNLLNYSLPPFPAFRL